MLCFLLGKEYARLIWGGREKRRFLEEGGVLQYLVESFEIVPLKNKNNKIKEGETF